MAQPVLKNDSMLIDYRDTTVDIVESIKKYIRDNECPDLTMDISNLNIIDASKVTILCSTFHWAKYPDGNISWKINSNDVEDLITPLGLGNINLINSQ
jgi:hypothetical protein